MAHIYLDHAATTSVRPEVMTAMMPYLDTRFGNPSSTHRWGREARNALEEARERLAAALGARRHEVLFTGAGTEADNLAVLGRWRAVRHSGDAGAIVFSAIEHKAVSGAALQAGREGAATIVLGVDEGGRVDLGALDEALRAEPSVVSVMWGNNEVGTVQAISEIAARCAATNTFLHSDAVQAFGKVRVRVDEVPLHALALSAHKLGGPKGIGALFLRDGVTVDALSHGGGQERELRPGTENVASATGFALAAELAVQELDREAARLRGLRDRLEAGLRAAIPDLVVFGEDAERLPHISNVGMPETDAEALLSALDLEGLAVSGGSACHSGSGTPSHVLAAMGVVKPGMAGARLSLGHATTAQEIEQAIAIFTTVAQRVRGVVAATKSGAGWP